MKKQHTYAMYWLLHLLYALFLNFAPKAESQPPIKIQSWALSWAQTNSNHAMNWHRRGKAYTVLHQVYDLVPVEMRINIKRTVLYFDIGRGNIHNASKHREEGANSWNNELCMQVCSAKIEWPDENFNLFIS